jgi:hypothetical protein
MLVGMLSGAFIQSDMMLTALSICRAHPLPNGSRGDAEESAAWKVTWFAVTACKTLMHERWMDPSEAQRSVDDLRIHRKRDRRIERLVPHSDEGLLRSIQLLRHLCLVRKRIPRRGDIGGGGRGGGGRGLRHPSLGGIDALLHLKEPENTGNKMQMTASQRTPRHLSRTP